MEVHIAPVVIIYYNVLFQFKTVSQRSKLQDKLDLLRLRYPCCPSIDEFSQVLLSSEGIHDAEQNEFHILSKFTVAYPQLKVGGEILPDLIEFYNWIHRELKFLVEETYALKNGMEEIITKGDKKFTDLGLHNLYERVKGEGWELKRHSFSLYFCLSYPDGFNRYMDTIGGYISVGSSGDQRSRQDVFHISDSTTLIHFLSIDREASSEATMETDYLTMNGWLLTVILDIVSMA